MAAPMDAAADFRDREHLRLLAIFHYVVGGIMAVGGCCPGVYIAMGFAFLTSPEKWEPRSPRTPVPAMPTPRQETEAPWEDPYETPEPRPAPWERRGEAQPPLESEPPPSVEMEATPMRWEAHVQTRHDDVPPAFVGWMLIAMGALGVIFSWGLAICLFIAGRCLQRRRGYTFCIIVAALSCLFFPFGTVLGVFTLIVLLRPGVRPLFGLASPGEGVTTA